MTSERTFKSALYSGGIAASVVLLLWVAHLFSSIEQKSLDIRFRLFAKPETASKDIVIAVIDDRSLQAYEKQNIPWPWPRSLYAELVGFLRRGGAKVIAFDMIFATNDIYSMRLGEEEEDTRFLDSMQTANNVLLAAQLKSDIAPSNHPLIPLQKFSLPRAASSSEIFSSAILPPVAYQQSSFALGTVNYFSDNDGICRRLPLVYYFQHQTIPHLGLAAHLTRTNDSVKFLKEKSTLLLNETSVQLDGDGNFLLWWYGPGGSQGSFKYYSIHQLIQSAIQLKRGQQPWVSPDSFKNKTVIIGTNASGLFDFRNTPFTAIEPYPGMEIYATIASNLLQKDFLQQGNRWITFLFIVFFSFGVSYAMFFFRKVTHTMILAVGSGILLVIFAFWAFTTYKMWFEIVSPLFAIAFSFALSASWSYSTEGKARRQLRSMFQRYLDSSVVARIEENPRRVELGGQETNAVVFFSDIERFTSISEQLLPKDVVHHLNEYFTLLVGVLLEHRAFLDKYYGDSVMAMFGVPIPQEDDALRGCTAALAIQNALRERTKQSSAVFTNTRIGLHSGSMLVGNIGSPRRMEYTAIGDTVNVAARLESANKIYGSSILISEPVFQKVHNAMLCRELDMVTLRGKEQPLRIFELLSSKKIASADSQNLIERFNAALVNYRQRQFKTALEQFSVLLSSYPTDVPTQVYIERCKNFIATSPSLDWDGVFELTSK